MVQCFTRDLGRLTGVMRGVRGRTKASYPVPQPFQLVELSISGRSPLATITGFEVLQFYELNAQVLPAGFYVLELLSRALAERQQEPVVFDATVSILSALAQPATDHGHEMRSIAGNLRRFELVLLSELGFGIDFSYETQQQGARLIQSEQRYQFVPEQGFLADPQGEFSGHILQAIARGQREGGELGPALRRITRLALQPLIGDKPLLSRAMLPPTPSSSEDV